MTSHRSSEHAAAGTPRPPLRRGRRHISTRATPGMPAIAPDVAAILERELSRRPRGRTRSSDSSPIRSTSLPSLGRLSSVTGSPTSTPSPARTLPANSPQQASPEARTRRAPPRLAALPSIGLPKRNNALHERFRCKRVEDVHALIPEYLAGKAARDGDDGRQGPKRDRPRRPRARPSANDEVSGLGRALALGRDTAAAFFEADVNGDKKLSLDEFKRLVPADVATNFSDAAIGELFRTCDADGNGEVSLDEVRARIS